MRLEITEGHLEQGEPKNAARCPIALVVKKLLREKEIDATCFVHNNAFSAIEWPPRPYLKIGRWGSGGLRHKFVYLRMAGVENYAAAVSSLSSWLHAYDGGLEVKPITVEAEGLEKELEATS